MAAPPTVCGQNDRLAVQIKLSDQIAYQPGAHQRVIDRAEDDAIGFDTIQTSYPRADGRQLALLPIGIQNDHGVFQLCDGADFVRAGAEHDTGHADARMAGYLNQMFEESAFTVGN